MKKVLPLLAMLCITLTFCKKSEEDRACYDCWQRVTVYGTPNVSYNDTTVYCDKTPAEISEIKKANKGGTVGNTYRTAMKCDRK